MDNHTLELLEFDRIRTIVAGYAACSLGKDAARQMEPDREIGAVRQSQSLTTEMTEALSAGLSPPLGGVHDIRASVRRAQVGSTLEADELAVVAEVLRATVEVDSWLGRIGDEFPRLGALRPSIGEFSGVLSAIAACLDDRGKVLDTASRRLSALRAEIGKVEERIQETLRRMLRSPEIRRILRYPNFTMVGHHYVLPIAKDHRGEIQGSVHRTSATNETVFIEPQAIAEHSAQLSFVRAKETKEIRRILRWLSAQVGQVADSMLGTIDTLAELDLIYARGRYSLDYRHAPPDVTESGPVMLRSARHPLLEYLFRHRVEPTPPIAVIAEGEEAPAPLPPSPRPTVVPIDVHLGHRFRILVVTGPNTGGKTVAIKTVGLMAAMAQCGLHIPAAVGSQLPVFDAILADIGDEQSLEQSLSTFSSHVRRVSQIFAVATERSLVLLDEMGAGTDPAEGAALGRSILDEIDSVGCLAIVTTHIGDLKTYAFTNSRAENAAVEFDLESLRPLYKLHIGDIGQSNALEIARRLDLPGHLIDRAAAYLKAGRGEQPDEWQVVQRLRREAEQARASALDQQAEAERTREALAQRLTDLQRQSEQDERIEEARSRLQPGDRVVVPKFGYDRPGRIVKVDPRKRVALVAIGQMKWDVPLAELIPQLIKGVDVPTGPPVKPSLARHLPSLDQFGDNG